MPRFRNILALSLFVPLTACDNGDRGAPSERSPDPSSPFAALELDASYPAPFAYLSGVRELADGRLFAADPLSQVFLRVDMDAGVADTLGTQGKGPQEYEGPDHVLPLPGDSTLLVDMGNARLTAVSPEGEFVEWSPMFRSRQDGSARTLSVRFADQDGNLYLTAPSDLEGVPPDSTGISRFDRADDTETVVAWAWHPERSASSRGERPPILIPMDDWAMGSDGSIAVVRANGLSVDWYRPDGEILVGPSHSVETYPVGEPEKAREMEELGRAAVFMSVVVDDGGEQSRQMTRGLPPGGGPGIDDFEWPEILPLFRPNGTLVSPRGEAWVERIMPRDHASRYEVFDSTGARLGFVALPTGARVIGFGSHPETRDLVYLARVDEVGFIWLERYRLLRG
ncbi:MAG: hypothetical protein PVJ04_12745 [Gemmatimonadota bacterium]|jgi:hypothetical protein